MLKTNGMIEKKNLPCICECKNLVNLLACLCDEVDCFVVSRYFKPFDVLISTHG